MPILCKYDIDLEDPNVCLWNKILGIYLLGQTWKTHIFFTASYLQSVFIVLDFNSNCISSINTQDVDIIYDLRYDGYWYFGFGFGLLFLYLLSSLLIFLNVKALIQNSRKLILWVVLLILEVVISVDFFYRISIFNNFLNLYETKENERTHLSILLPLILRSLVIYLLIILRLLFILRICKMPQQREAVIRDVENAWWNNAWRERAVGVQDVNRFGEGIERGSVHINPSGSAMFCTICLEEMKPGQETSRIKTCKHLFHKLCLNQWGNHKQNCPMCRRNII